MGNPCRVLMLGASYGSLLASKLLLAGHTVHLVCLPAEAELIGQEGFRVRFPVRGRERSSRRRLAAAAGQAVRRRSAARESVGLRSRRTCDAGAAVPLSGRARASRRRRARANSLPVDHEHAAAAVLEPSSAGDRERPPGLLYRSFRMGQLRSRARDAVQPRPAGVSTAGREGERAAGGPADQFQGRALRFRLAHGDAAQVAGRHRRRAVRHRSGRHRAAGQAQGSRFGLRAARQVVHAADRQLPLHSRGLGRSIRDAVHGDLERSRSIYEWVAALCVAMGAAKDDLVPFEKYAHAASSLSRPSSVARAVANGATDVERVDRLVQSVAARKGMRSDAIDEIVALVDRRLDANRQATVH